MIQRTLFVIPSKLMLISLAIACTAPSEEKDSSESTPPLSPISQPAPPGGGSTTVAIPVTPENVVATSGLNSVHFTWDAVDGAESYRIYLSSSADITTTTPHIEINAFLKQYSKVVGDGSSEAAFARISAVNSAGESALSTVVSAIPGSQTGQPIITAVNPGDGSVTVTWSPADNATGYNLEYEAEGVINTIENVTSPHTLANLSNATVHRVNVIAKNAVSSILSLPQNFIPDLRFRQTGGNPDFERVTSGADKYLAITGRSVYLSEDGATWTESSTFADKLLLSVTFGNNLFVVGGAWGEILTSLDGASWTTTKVDETAYFHYVHYANSTFIAGGDSNGTIYYSNGTAAWQSVTVASGERIYGISYFDDSWFVFTDNEVYKATAPEGPWTEAASSVITQAKPVAVVASSTLMAMVVDVAGSRGNIYYSSDGVTWLEPDSGYQLKSVAAVDETFYLLGKTFEMHTTGDFVTINAVALPSINGDSPDINSAAGDTARSVIVGDAGLLLSATNHAAVASSSTGILANLTAVAALDDNYIVLSDNYMGRSSDFETFSKQSPANTTHEGIASGNGRFVVFNSSRIQFSADGSSWIDPAVSGMDDLRAIKFVNPSFYLLGSDSKIAESTNGGTWTVHTLAGSYEFNDITKFSSLFVIVGNNGLIQTTPDFSTVETQTSNTTHDLIAVAANSSTVVVVGRSQVSGSDHTVIMYSSDGSNWVTVSGVSSLNIKDVFWTGSVFLAYGHTDLLTSADGITWKIRGNEANCKDLALNSDGDTLLCVGDNGYLATRPVFTD